MINEDSPEHPYIQLAGIIRSQIQSGDIGPRVPSITQLSEQYQLSQATVKRALRVLADEGLIYAVRGRGTFVRSLLRRMPQVRVIPGYGSFVVGEATNEG